MAHRAISYISHQPGLDQFNDEGFFCGLFHSSLEMGGLDSKSQLRDISLKHLIITSFLKFDTHKHESDLISTI